MARLKPCPFEGVCFGCGLRMCASDVGFGCASDVGLRMDVRRNALSRPIWEGAIGIQPSVLLLLLVAWPRVVCVQTWEKWGCE
jgi:hypothetical protein